MPKIEFEGKVPVEHEELTKQVRLARGLGLPYIQDVEVHDKRLAVVGGGPSVKNHLDELHQYDEIWSINGTTRWLASHGIESTLLALDPCDFLADHVSGAKRAYLASRCHPNVFLALKDADVSIYDVMGDFDGERQAVWASVSAVTAAFHLSAIRGFRDTTFYGIEGSFDNETHLYMHEISMHLYRFVVECGGDLYTTSPDLYAQCKAMVPLMRTFKAHFKERCGGLLRAMIAHDDHDIVQVTKALRDGLIVKT